MSPHVEIQIIAVIVAITCTLPGAFLVLRNMSMVADSITHTILLGIVLAFSVTHDLSSPLLIIGAAIMGIATIWLNEMLVRTKLVAEDAAIGVIFPFLFSIAIILITRQSGSFFLDTNSVLLGELAFTPFDRMIVGGIDIGAKAIYTTGAILLINLSFIVIFFKELKIATFDPILAFLLGLAPTIIHYGLMAMASVTIVGSFQVVGSLLVVAFMIGPPVTASLLTHDLKWMLILSSLIGAFNGIIGYHIAVLLNVSIAGSIAITIGFVFLLFFLFAPQRGCISTLRRRNHQKIHFAKSTLLLYLDQSDADNNTIGSISNNLQWHKYFTKKIIHLLIKDRCIKSTKNMIHITDLGRTTCINNYKILFK